jgi:hypothetical protein
MPDPMELQLMKKAGPKGAGLFFFEIAPVAVN